MINYCKNIRTQIGKISQSIVPMNLLKKQTPNTMKKNGIYLLRARLYQHKIDMIEQIIHLLDVDIEYEPTVQGRAKSLSDTGIFKKNGTCYNIISLSHLTRGAWIEITL